jgi:hypothetical protein
MVRQRVRGAPAGSPTQNEPPSQRARSMGLYVVGGANAVGV